jgi:hypothetical protein
MRLPNETLQSTLCGAMREAANYHEPFERRVTRRIPQTFETALNRIPSRYSGLMLNVARRALKRDQLSALLTGDAYELVCARSASPYYFWRILADTAEHSRTLPFTVEDVQKGINELRKRILIATGLGQQLARSPMPKVHLLVAPQRVELHREGFIVCKPGAELNLLDTDTFELNPLFVD